MDESKNLSEKGESEMRRNLVIILVAALFASLLACTVPLPQAPEATASSTTSASTLTPAAPAANTGTVKLSIPHLAPWAQAAMQKHKPSKAFMEADYVEVDVYLQGGGYVTTWEAWPGSVVAYGNWTAASLSNSLPAGDYVLDAWVYNNNSSPNLVVSGSTEINVQSGLTTNATITCLPDYAYGVSNDTWSGLAWYGPGTENWFSVPASDSQAFVSVQVDRYVWLYYYIFNSDGTYSGYAGNAYGGISQISVPPSDNGYYVVLWASDSCYAQMQWTTNGQVNVGIK